MNTIERYYEIAEKRDLPTIVPFLKSLSPQERETLRNEVVKSHKKNKIYRTNSYSPYMDVQMFVHFFCFHKEDNDYLRMMWRDLPKLEEMEQLLDEEVPEHFPGLLGAFLVNRHLNKDLYGKSAISYEDTMRFIRKGYVADIEPYIAMRMDELFPRRLQEETRDPEAYIADRLTAYPEILDHQIFYLFRYPNEVSYSDKLGAIKIGKTGPWSYILKTQTQNGRLDRMQLLRECLVSLARPYKKDQLNWFVDLFEGMEPTDQELLLLQDDLFAALLLPLTKATGMVLNAFKCIATDKTFRKEDFLNHAQILILSDTKAIVTRTIAVLEKLSVDKQMHKAICNIVATVLDSKEESVQIRATKLLTRLCGSPADSSQPLANEKDKTHHSPRRMTEEKRIRPVESIEELIFALSEAFATFDPANFYLIPDSLFRFREEMNEEVIVKMGPSIQGAYKLIISHNPDRSYHSKLTAYLLLKYCQHLFSILPEGGKQLQKLRDTYDTQWEYIDRWWNETEGSGGRYVAFEGFRRLTLSHLQKLTSADKLPILSTPTHHLWLDPAVLLKRIKMYEEADTEPDTMDFQQALQLCPLEEGLPLLSAIAHELSGEYRALLRWLFDVNAPLPPSAERPHKEWWLTAAIIRPDRDIPTEMLDGIDPVLIPYLRNQFTCEPYIYEFVSHIDIDHQTGKETPVMHRTSSLRFDQEFLKSTAVEDLNLFIAYSYIGYPWAASFLGNIKQIMLSSPNNGQTYLMKLAKETIQHASDTIGKHMTVVLEIYRQIMPQAGEMDYMYLCLCFLQKDKTLRTYLADVWAEMSEAGCIDNTVLGEMLGRFIEIEYAPLKRVTDTMQDYMIRRSSFLNKELGKLIQSCLCRVNQQPVNGLTKLLFIQKELTKS